MTSVMLKKYVLRVSMIAIAIMVNCFCAYGEVSIAYHASLSGQASSKSLAPYMLGSWNEGRYVEGSGIWQEAGIGKELDLTKRISWSAGVDYIAGVGSKTYYDRWIEAEEKWTTHRAKLPNIRLQQLFAQVKFRQVSLTVGMKYSHSKIVDDQLSSGDLTRSNNAAPVPGIAGGFLDFQNIPFTNGWVQIDGKIMYGRMMDSGFKKAEFNYYTGVEAINLWYNYKRCYFRTNPDKNFHVTVGMQAASFDGGAMCAYYKGKLLASAIRGFVWAAAFQMFFPRPGGESYYAGSHLGTWDLKAVYKFKDESKVSAYFEWPWEDGSGIGKMNGWDGLWGVKYDFARKGIITKALVEYLDFTNQSGPIHFDPDDVVESPLVGHAQGADDYYNNDFYGAYTNYGMSIGTPYLVAPIYNLNGVLRYQHTRARGFHVAVAGNPSDRLSYRAMLSYEKAGGSGRLPAYKRLESTSAMIEANMIPIKRVPGLELNVRVAFDAGSLRNNNWGVRLQMSYSGEFKIKGKK